MRVYNETKCERRMIFLIFSTQKENIGMAKIFDFLFLMDLYVFGNRKRDLSISGKSLSVSVFVCDTNVVAALEQKLLTEFQESFN